MRTLDIWLGQVLCALGRHDYVFVRRRHPINSGATAYRLDECKRCGAQETWREVDGVKRERVWTREVLRP